MKNYTITSGLLNNEYLYIEFAPYRYLVISLDTYETVGTNTFCQDVSITSLKDIYYLTIWLLMRINLNIKVKRTNQLNSKDSIYYASLE